VSEDETCLAAFQTELDYIYRTLRRLGTAPFELDDMAQDVFLAMKSSWKRYDATRPLRPYLFGIAFRVVAAQTRKRQREIPRSFVDVVDESGTPDEALQAKQARATVLAALEKVPLPRRAVLVMHDIDETPVAEIAEILSIPLFTAYSRLRKARVELNAALRRMLREVGEK
jgi:RNA polymerase sigma-70 factor (ECF subfamily)